MLHSLDTRNNRNEEDVVFLLIKNTFSFYLQTDFAKYPFVYLVTVIHTLLCCCSSYLHSCDPPIIHGNLTCDTIFIQHNGLIKIGSGEVVVEIICDLTYAMIPFLACFVP